MDIDWQPVMIKSIIIYNRVKRGIVYPKQSELAKTKLMNTSNLFNNKLNKIMPLPNG